MNTMQEDYPCDLSQASSHLTTCLIHEKPVEFYCERHFTFHCSKCISIHIECQVKDQFHRIEDLSDKFKLQLNFTLKALNENQKNEEQKARELRNQFIVIEGLATRDLQSIDDYFEDIKRAAQILKESAIKQYQIGYAQLIDKLSRKEKQMQEQALLIQNTIRTLNDLQENISKLMDPLHRSIQSILSIDQLAAEEKELDRQKNLLETITLNDELNRMINREQIYSELGNQTTEAMKMAQMVQTFVKDKLIEIVEDQQMNLQMNIQEKQEEIPEEIKLKKAQIIEELFGIGEPDLVFSEERRTIYIQLRYCSNQMYVYDIDKEKFDTYYLYTSELYNVPFNIFHNCAQAIFQNHIVFLFGGEDTAQNEKSSHRAFCLNLERKSDCNKVAVYELNGMLFPRSEFSIASIANNIYLISGYNSNQIKEQRVISKCEKFDLKSKRFYEIRDINYPRIYAGLVNWQNQYIYAFGGKNPKYMNVFVEKIEKYQINLNDWSVLKYHINESVDYSPTMRSACFKVTDNEIIILGGSNDSQVTANYYIFDVKKLIMQKKSNQDIMCQPDEFVNQNDLALGKKDNTVYLMSANFVKKLYILFYQQENNELVCIPLQAEIN